MVSKRKRKRSSTSPIKKKKAPLAAAVAAAADDDDHWGWTTDHHLVGKQLSSSALAIPTDRTSGCSTSGGGGGSSSTATTATAAAARLRRPATMVGPMVRTDPLYAYSILGGGGAGDSTLTVACFQGESKYDRKPALWRTLVRCSSSPPGGDDETDNNTNNNDDDKAADISAVALAIDHTAADGQEKQSKATATATNNNNNNKQQQLSSSSPPMMMLIPNQSAVTAVQERLFSTTYETVMDEWMPNLVLIAAQEEITSNFVRQVLAPNANNAATDGSSNNNNSADTNAYRGEYSNSDLPAKYYRQHPSGYMEKPENAAAGGYNNTQNAAVEAVYEDALDLLQVQPSSLVARIKQGCAMAWAYYTGQWQQQFSKEIRLLTEGPSFLSTVRNNQQQQRLQQQQDGGVQRTSRRLMEVRKEQEERVLNATGQTDARALWKVLPGGKVATYLIEQVTILEERAKKEKETKTKKGTPTSTNSTASSSTNAAAAEYVETKSTPAAATATPADKSDDDDDDDADVPATSTKVESNASMDLDDDAKKKSGDESVVDAQPKNNNEPSSSAVEDAVVVNEDVVKSSSNADNSNSSIKMNDGEILPSTPSSDVEKDEANSQKKASPPGDGTGNVTMVQQKEETAASLSSPSAENVEVNDDDKKKNSTPDDDGGDDDRSGDPATETASSAAVDDQAADLELAQRLQQEYDEQAAKEKDAPVYKDDDESSEKESEDDDESMEEKDEDFCPAEQDDGDSDDDEPLQKDCVRENLKNLEEDLVQKSSNDESEEEEEEEDDDDDSEEDTSDIDVLDKDNNPYLRPSVPAVFEFLGRKTAKGLVTADVQAVFPKLLHVEKPKKKGSKKKGYAVKPRVPVTSAGGAVWKLLSPLDRLIWSRILRLDEDEEEEEEENYEGFDQENALSMNATRSHAPMVSSISKEARLVFELSDDDAVTAATSSDIVDELEPQAFGRSWFSLRIRDYNMEQKLALRASDKLERVEDSYKQDRAWATYRFKAIHGGHTIWPSWRNAVETWSKEKHEQEAQHREESSEPRPATPVIGGTTTTDEVAQPGQQLQGAAASGTELGVQDDMALAQKLAGEDEVDSSLTRRATRSRGNDKKGGASGGAIFYGNQSNMTQKQLMDTLLRLVSAQKFESVMGLMGLVQDDSSDPVRRIRTAVGRLVWKRNQLARLAVQTKWSDVRMWEALGKGGILKRSSELNVAPSAGAYSTLASTDGAISENGNKEGSSDAIQQLQQLNNDWKDGLEEYLAYLHRTELRLRSMVLKHLTEIPIAIIATAADERVGSLEALDDTLFKESDNSNATDDDVSPTAKIEWHSTGHPLLNRHIFRPAVFQNTDDHTTCYWYTIVDYSPASEAHSSLEGNADERPAIGSAKEPASVERRIRFRAAPWRDSDEPCRAEDYRPEELLLLTEGQVQAGLKAAQIEEPEQSSDESITLLEQQMHPFAGSIGTSSSRITLCPISSKELSTHQQQEPLFMKILASTQQTSKDREPDITGTIVGYDTVEKHVAASTSNDNKLSDSGTEEKRLLHRVLFLPDRDRNSNDSDNFNDYAFWGTLDVTSSEEYDGLILCCSPQQQGRCDDTTPVPNTRRYGIKPCDYDSSSQAHRECRSIINHLRRNPKSEAFMEPVDPVALGIPEYFNVIKQPMDISTLDKNLEEGKYSNVSIFQRRKSSNDIEDSSGNYSSPVARMLNGPFREDMELIFDNAVRYNQPNDWIHQAALAIKKSILKKLDQATKHAEEKFWMERQQPYRSSSRRSHVPTSTSIYVDEDSDVDMYEYESDQDDDYISNRRKRGTTRKRSGQSTVKEDPSARAVERPCRIHKIVNESGLRGPLANFPVQTDASNFALDSQAWTCRGQSLIRKHQDLANSSAKEAEDDHAERQHQEEQMQLDELLAMHRQVEDQEAAGVRRSTRTVTVPAFDDFYQNGKQRTGSNNHSLEFCFRGDPEVIMSSIQAKIGSKKISPPKNRLEIELLQERLHEEYFAKLYYEKKKFLSSCLDDGDGDFGMFKEGSFPPFLGRAVPLSFSASNDPTAQQNQDKFHWEIRSPYILPALRWVLRGLVESQHLSAVEGITATDPLQSGVLLANHMYYIDKSMEPFDVLDLKELQRRKRGKEDMAIAAEREKQDEIELSEYEKMRAERVARNADRLKALGLA